MVGVNDGNDPDVWIGSEQPYSKEANPENFIWALERWDPESPACE